MDYTTGMFERVTQANKRALESTMKINEIALRTQGELFRRQLGLFEECLEVGTRQLKLLTEGRDPREVVTQGAEVSMELGQKMAGTFQEALKLQAEARDEIVKVVEDVFKGMEPAKTGKPETRSTSATKAAPKAA